MAGSYPCGTPKVAACLADPNVRNLIRRMSNPTRMLSVTEAAGDFAEVVDRALYRDETTVLVKNGAPVAQVAPLAPNGISASELARRWALLPRLSPDDADAFARDVEAARAELPAPVDPWA